MDTIKTKDIVTAPWNTRTEITDDSVRALAESIKVDGLLQPISVFKPDGEWICFDGNRRLAACRLLKMPTIRVNVFDGLTVADAKIKTVTANLQREDDDPLLAAKVIAENDEAPETIAAKLGKSVSWVRRRGKLNALNDTIKGFVGKITLDALEKISDLTPELQAKMVKPIENRLKWMNGAAIKWADIKRDAENLTLDLTTAFFDTADCVGCTERTGADWFADEDAGKLGRCLNCKCFRKKVQAWKDGLIAANIPADAEREEVSYEWDMPYEARNDSKSKRDKKHPCAYYWFTGGNINVKWSKSKKQIDEDHERERQEKLAANEEQKAADERNTRIDAAISEWLKSDGAEIELRRRVGNLTDLSDSQKEMIVDVFIDWLDEWHDSEELAKIITRFDFIANLADVSESDAEWFIENNSEES